MRSQFVLVTVAGLTLLIASLGEAPAATEEPGSSARGTIAVQHVTVPVFGLRDEAAMVLVGTALIGLASAVRRVP